MFSILHQLLTSRFKEGHVCNLAVPEFVVNPEHYSDTSADHEALRSNTH